MTLAAAAADGDQSLRQQHSRRPNTTGLSSQSQQCRQQRANQRSHHRVAADATRVAADATKKTPIIMTTMTTTTMTTTTITTMMTTTTITIMTLAAAAADGDQSLRQQHSRRPNTTGLSSQSEPLG